MLILNKKQIANHEQKLFEAELEKFRSHQNRLLQANHKQSSVMKELTRTYGDLLQDKRVRSEQAKYDTFTRQRGTVMNKYRKVFTSFNDLLQGLGRAEAFYSEMKETVENLQKNVDTFVNNRREEGGQLLGSIERRKQTASGATADREQERLRDLMERMNVSQPTPSPSSGLSRSKSSATRPQQLSPQPSYNQPGRSSAALPQAAYGYPIPPSSPPYNGKPSSQPGLPYHPSHSPSPGHHQQPPSQPFPGYPGHNPANGSPSAYHHPGYDPTQYPYQSRSPPVPQGSGAPPPVYGHPPPGATYPPYGQPLLQGYVPPPPPPGPPPGGQQPQQQQHYAYGAPPPGGTGGYPQSRPMQGQIQGQGGQGDPWAGLGAWK